jgi:hypothetical protein
MKKDEIQLDKKFEWLFDQFRLAPDRDPRKIVDGRADFLKQARNLQAAGPQQPQRAPVRRGWFNQVRPSSPEKRPFPLLNSLVAAVLALIFVFGATSATVYAAQGSLPGEVLYPVKTLSEDTFLSLSSSPLRRLGLTLDFSDRRIAEMAALQSAGLPIPQKVTEHLQDELDQVLIITAGLDDQAAARVLEQVSRRTEAQMQAMTLLISGKPTTPAFQNLQTRLQVQVQMADMGEADFPGFRVKVHQQFQTGNETPGNGQNEPVNSDSTPVAPGNGNGSGGNPPGAGQLGHGNDKPTKTPGNPGHDPNNKP